MGLSAATTAALRDGGLDPDAIETIARLAVAEDLDGGLDVTTVATVPAGHHSRGAFVPRRPGVVAGLPVAAAVLEVVVGDGLRLERPVADGAAVAAGTEVLVAHAPTAAMLTAERTALNLLGRLSGIATATRAWVDAVAGTGAAIRDTRKTTPGLRAREKYAVRCGGGVNHRMSLSDAALVKDNHVVAAGGVGAAFRAVRGRFPGIPLEIECDTVEQVAEAIAEGADLVLLDNMSLDDTRRAVALARAQGGVRLEASGGLTLATARAVAETGVDFLAVGALTHSSPVLDIGLDVTAAR
ncbi:MAG: carboxylating nicotinate-nucleotide diphosphorylase [Acidimicrobiales bacterium]